MSASRRIVFASFAVCLLAQGWAQSVANSAAITEDRLRDHLTFIASDLLEGRNTPSKGLDIACTYVATQLKLWGVKPGGDDGGYFQKINLTRGTADLSEKSWIKIGDTTIKAGDGFIPDAFPGTASGNVVFVGYGWKFPDKGVDPYKGIDIKGKFILAENGLPEGYDFRSIRTARAAGALGPEDIAAAEGAAGVLYIPNTNNINGWSAMAQPRQAGGFRIEAPSVKHVMSMLISKSTLAQLLEGANTTADELVAAADTHTSKPSFNLSASKRIEATVAVNQEVQTTQNVVGIIEGTDPKLKAEYVAVGAHIDHLGTSTRGGTDTIYNGADDDGSGTVSILEIAHAFATGAKPKRSLIFVWHCGEEKGLWGSSFFVNHPTVPLKDIVAQLNIDMIGRSRPAGDTKPANAKLTGPDAVYIIGSRRLSSDLGNAARAANQSMYKIDYDEGYDKPNDPESLFSRSDHYNYAQMGIPILFWFDGIHEDYHQVSDEVQKIDFRKMARVAQTVYATAMSVGNAKARPKIDLPLNPE